MSLSLFERQLFWKYIYKWQSFWLRQTLSIMTRIEVMVSRTIQNFSPFFTWTNRHCVLGQSWYFQKSAMSSIIFLVSFSVHFPSLNSLYLYVLSNSCATVPKNSFFSATILSNKFMQLWSARNLLWCMELVVVSILSILSKCLRSNKDQYLAPISSPHHSVPLVHLKISERRAGLDRIHTD